MILAKARPWSTTPAGAPRGYALVRAGERLPLLAAETVASPSPAGAPPEAPVAAGNVLYIYDVIGRDFWTGGGVTADEVMQALAALGAGETLDVRINSPGGDVFEGIAIFNALARHRGGVHVHVDALSASIATVIQLAGAKVSMAENALMMIHLPYTVMVANADEARAEADILEKLWEAMAATYSRRSGMGQKALRTRVAESPFGEWWLTAAEAVKAGFADEIESPAAGAPVKAMAEGVRFRAGPEELRVATEGEKLPPRPRGEVPELAAPPHECSPEDVEARRRQVEVLELEA